MATRKTKKKSSHRKKMSGGLTKALNPSSPLVRWGSVLLGFLAEKMINPLIDKVTGTTNAKIVAGGQVGLGGLYLLSKGKKSLLPTILAGLLAGAGVKRAFTAFGIGRLGGYGQVPALGSYGDVPAIGYRKVSGYAPQGTLAGYAPQGTLNGPNVMGGVGSGNGSDLVKDGSSSLMG